MPATIPDLTNTTTWTDGDLDALRVHVLREQERRYVLATAEARAEQTAAQWRAAQEAALPQLPAGQHRAWSQPLGAHDVYQRGALVSHGGKVWESLHPANAWTPGTDTRLWKDVTATAPAPAPGPTGTPWDGNSKAYKAGDHVTYKGAVYKVIGAHTSLSTWTPDVAHSLFVKV